MFDTKKLNWTQPNYFGRYYEFTSENKKIGSLSFQSSFSTTASAIFQNFTYTFQQVGKFNPSISILEDNSSSVLAVYSPASFKCKGVIKFNEGSFYNWSKSNFWNSEFILSDREGNTILKYELGADNKLFYRQVTVTLSQEGKANKHIELLICFCYYLIIQFCYQMESAAVVVLM